MTIITVSVSERYALINFAPETNSRIAVMQALPIIVQRTDLKQELTSLSLILDLQVKQNTMLYAANVAYTVQHTLTPTDQNRNQILSHGFWQHLAFFGQIFSPTSRCQRASAFAPVSGDGNRVLSGPWRGGRRGREVSISPAPQGRPADSTGGILCRLTREAGDCSAGPQITPAV